MVLPVSKIEKGEAKISITLGDDLVCFLANYADVIKCADGSEKPACELEIGEKIVFELFDGKDTVKKPTAKELEQIERLFSSKKRFYDKPLSDFVLYN